MISHNCYSPLFLSVTGDFTLISSLHQGTPRGLVNCKASSLYPRRMIFSLEYCIKCFLGYLQPQLHTKSVLFLIGRFVFIQLTAINALGFFNGNLVLLRLLRSKLKGIRRGSHRECPVCLLKTHR